MFAIPVCSDSKVGSKKRGKSEIEADDNVLALNELLYPATTNEHALASSVTKALAMQQKQAQQGLVVVFSTYQSLDVISRAQQLQDEPCVPEFDLIICDEAHHTAGAYLLNELTQGRSSTYPDQEQSTAPVAASLLDGITGSLQSLVDKALTLLLGV